MTRADLHEKLIMLLLFAWWRVENTKLRQEREMWAKMKGIDSEEIEDPEGDAFYDIFYAVISEHVARKLLGPPLRGNLLGEEEWKRIARQQAVRALLEENQPIASASLRWREKEIWPMITRLQQAASEELQDDSYDRHWKFLDAVIDLANERGEGPLSIFERTEPYEMYCLLSRRMFTVEEYRRDRAAERAAQFSPESLRAQIDDGPWPQKQKEALRRSLRGQGRPGVRALIEEECRIFDAITNRDLEAIYGEVAHQTRQ